MPSHWRAHLTGRALARAAPKEHLKVFAGETAAEAWFTEHDPEGVAFEYPVME
jgi:hypothetical protein